MWNLVKRINWKQSPYYIMYFASFAMIGMFDFANGRFDPFRVMTAEYWQSVGTLMLASILILLSAANKTIAQQTETDPGIKEKQDMFEKIAKSKEIDDIDEYLTELNLNRKKFMYIESIKKKLDKLENGVWYKPFSGSKIKDRMLYNDPDVSKDVKMKNKYCRKRFELDYLMSDDYIKASIHDMRIRFPKITRTFVTVGVDDAGDLPWITTTKSKKMFKDLSPRFMFSVGFGAFITSFIPELGTSMTWGIAFSIATKTVVLISNYIGGIEYGPNFIHTKTKVDLQYRYEIIVDYHNWKTERSKVNASTT